MGSPTYVHAEPEEAGNSAVQMNLPQGGRGVLGTTGRLGCRQRQEKGGGARGPPSEKENQHMSAQGRSGSGKAAQHGTLIAQKQDSDPHVTTGSALLLATTLRR